MPISDRTARIVEIYHTAVEGAIWGLPLVLSDLVRRSHPQTDRFYRLPADAALLAPGLIGSHGDMTVCSAVLDLSSGPVFLSLPDTGKAYRLLMLIDEWGQILATHNHRENHEDGREIAVVLHDWDGETAKGLSVVRSPSDRVWAICHLLEPMNGAQGLLPILGRTLPAGAGANERELETLSLDLQKSFDDTLRAMTPISFFRRLAKLLPSDPPDPQSAGIIRALHNIGIGSGDPINGSHDEIIALHEGAVEGLRRVRRVRPPANDPSQTGWSQAPSGVREPLGLLDRAANVLTGLGAAPAEEIMSFVTRTDVSGQLLTGAADYTLAFALRADPPANAFWSLSVTDAHGISIAGPMVLASARFKSPARAKEGLEISIRHHLDDAADQGLTAPDGPFGLRLDIYRPKPGLAHERWSPPGVVHLGRRHSGARHNFAKWPQRIHAQPAFGSPERTTFTRPDQRGPLQ